MAPEPDAQGIGTPSAHHPGFDAPADGSAMRPPTAPAPRTPQGWDAPHPGALVEAPPPTGRRPRHPQRSRRAMVAALIVGSLLLVGSLSALPMLSGSAPTDPAASGSPALVTASPSPVASTAATATGGGVGTAVAFTSRSGAGTVTVTSAVWTDAGALAPPAGQRYLVLDVTVACSSGQVPVSPLDLLVVAGPEKELPSYGPTLDRPLGGAVLAAGAKVSGQVGYAVTPGSAQLYLLDETLKRLAAVEVPAP